MEACIAVIDPISSGRRYGQEARSLGIKSIALLTGTAMPESLKRFASVEAFDEVHRIENLDETIGYLERQGVSAVVAGHHFALRLVDAVADRLGLACNPLAGVDARLNKLAMKQRLQDRGVAATRSHAINSATMDRFDSLGMKFPVVLKPSEGSGALNVKVCRNRADLDDGLRAIEALDAVYAGHDGDSLVEEFIEGPEHFITTANYGDGSRQLLCFAAYDKVQVDDRPSIYRNIYSLPIDTAKAQAAFQYACEVNHALDVVHGINDIEFKFTADGPRIIEQNNRLPGANVPFLIEQCTGINCYRLNLDIFSRQAPEPRPPVTYGKHFWICCLANEVQGVVEGMQGLDEVRALPGIAGVDLMVAPGDAARKTVDFITTWAFVYMVHEDPQQLRRNAEFIHDTMRLRVATTEDTGRPS
jgi:biotin carboxylase